VTPSAERTLSLIEIFNKNKTNKGAVNRFTNVHEGFIGKVKATNVQFTYEGNSNPTLKNINLEFNSGDVVALVGRSGSGKTTLADVIIGVLRPDIGEVKISNIISSEIPHNYVHLFRAFHYYTMVILFSA
jgi:ABC-type bacteriocin/lantibiotic exporter with double-glycine peptidase domain